MIDFNKLRKNRTGDNMTDQNTTPAPVGEMLELASTSMTARPSDIIVGMTKDYDSRPYFYVRPEKFQEMVSMDVSDFTKNLKGLDYLNYARAIYLMKMHFPSLMVQVVTHTEDEKELPYLDMDGGERGTLLCVFLQDADSGAVSQPLWFPVMTNAKGSVKPADIECDARSINDNIGRATAKLIAQITGIGFNLFLRMSDEELEAAELGTNRKPIEDVEDEEEEEEAKPVRGRTKSGKRRIVDEEEEDDDEEEEDDEDDEDDEDEEEEPVRRRSSRTSRTSRKEEPTTRRRGLPTRGR